MKRYKCIKKFGNLSVGEILIESNKIHPKWKRKQYFVEGGDEDDWVLDIHVKDEKYFSKIIKKEL